MSTETEQLENQESAAFRKRLGQAISMLGGLRAASEKVGVTEDSLANWRDNRAQPKFKNVVAFAKAAQVSLDWLAFGRGDLGCSHNGLSSTDENALCALVKRSNIPLFGGSLDCSKTLGSLWLEKDWILSALQSRPDSLTFFTAVGENMEPTIRSGDIVLYDTSIKGVSDSGLYVLSMEEGAVIRRIEIVYGKNVKIKSDNIKYKEEIYQSKENIDKNVIGLVRWIGKIY